MTTLKEEGCGTFGTELLKVYPWSTSVAIHDIFLTISSIVFVYKPQTNIRFLILFWYRPAVTPLGG